MAEENVPFFGTSRGYSTLNVNSSSNKIPWFPRNIKVSLVDLGKYYDIRCTYMGTYTYFKIHIWPDLISQLPIFLHFKCID